MDRAHAKWLKLLGNRKPEVSQRVEVLTAGTVVQSVDRRYQVAADGSWRFLDRMVPSA